MAVTLTTAARNAACDAIVDLIDAGVAAGTLELLLADATTEVATLTFSDPAFGAAATGVATASAITSDTSATGNAAAATVAKLKDSAGTEVLRCSVGTSGADINLSNNVIAAGETVAISSLTVTVPA